MLSLTVGGPEAAYSNEGLYGSIDQILHPLNHGVLAFVGFFVLEPFVVYGPARMVPAARAAELDRLRRHLLDIEHSRVLPMIEAADYSHFVRRKRELVSD